MSFPLFPSLVVRALPNVLAERRPGASSCTAAGFGLVQLLVVMLIMGLLVALGLPALASVRQTANLKAAVAAAGQYKAAIDAFALDHKGRLPAPGTADWPVAEEGPRDFAGRPYLRQGAPDSVASGAVGFGGERPVEGSRPHITYEPLGGTRYRLVVWSRRGNGWTQCSIGRDESQERC